MSNGIKKFRPPTTASRITKLVQSAQALVSQAQQANNTTTQASLSGQFDALLTQIGQLAGDSGFNGINLLAGNTLTVTLNESSSPTVAVLGADYTNANAAPLNIANAANNWSNATDITAAATALTAALTSLQSKSQTLSASLSTVQIRQDFTKATMNTRQTGSADLTLAELQPGRRQPASLQTRQQLSSTALSLASQADQNVLRLFR